MIWYIFVLLCFGVLSCLSGLFTDHENDGTRLVISFMLIAYLVGATMALYLGINGG